MLLLLLWILAAPTLIGHVTDGAGGPVAGAVVRLLADGGAVEVLTDDRGRFRFEVDGMFQIEIRHPEFRSVASSSCNLFSEGVYEIVVPLLPGSPSQVDRLECQVVNPYELLADREQPGTTAGLPRSDRLFDLRGGVNVSGIAEGTGGQWVAASGTVFASSTAALLADANLAADRARPVEPGAGLPAGQDILRGAVQYAHRNDRLNARNFFDPADAPPPAFKYHFFRGEAGGRMGEGSYFFGEYQGLRLRQSIARAATVPPPAWLDGDFSMLPETIIDPELGFPFPDNRIPEDRIHPLGLAIARMYPPPNVPGASVQNFRSSRALQTAADAFGFRFDRRLTLADEASFEYEFGRDTTSDPFNLLSGITNLPAFGVRDALQTHVFRAGNTHVFSGAVIQQLRIAVEDIRQPRTLLASAENAPSGPALLITGLSNLGHAANLPQQRRSRSFEANADVSWLRPGSTTRFGGTFRYLPFQASMDLYNRGQFQFTGGVFAEHAFANLLLGLPANALRIDGETLRHFRTWTLAAYVQHDRRLTPGLTINAGLRYDFQSPYRERDGQAGSFNPESGQVETTSSGLYEADRNNFGPRVGLAWQAPAGVLVRAGYGVFYDVLPVGDSLYFLGLNPPFVKFLVEDNGQVLPRFDIGTAFENALEGAPPSVFSVARDFANPYIQRWSLSIQPGAGRNFAVELAYFGQKGTRLRRQVNINQPRPGLPGEHDDRRPFPDFRNIFQFETSASSIAHAGEARVTSGFSSRFGFTATYRFSRSIDDATLISMLPQNSYDLRGERGLSDFHVKHRFVMSGTYSLPRAWGLGGWQIHAIGIAQSGAPISAVLGSDLAGAGSPIVNRPDLVGDVRSADPTPSRFFNPAAFQAPEPGRFGTSGRNVIIGPGMQNLDVALSRTFRASDFTRLQFRADIYNALNHPNFVAPPSMQNLADSPDFGALFVARSPRILQLGLKFLW